jgi:hypothetical protein
MSQQAITEAQAKRMLYQFCEHSLKQDSDPALKQLVRQGMGDLSG